MLSLAPIFDGKRTIPSAEVTNLMLDMLTLTYLDRVLEIGTGSGYQTQRFAETGAEVHTIEIEPWIDSTVVTGDCVFGHSGDGRLGIPEAAPFTAIVATCGVEQIPDEWREQLAENGQLLVPIGDTKSQRLTLFRKEAGELDPERVGAYVRFQMLREKPKHRPPQYDPYGKGAR